MKNVISMNAYGRHRGDSRQNQLLRGCRERMQRHLTGALRKMLGKVDDALFELAEKAENNAVQTQYFDAMREVRLKRDGIEKAFEKALLEGFEAALDPAGSENEPVGLDGELGLVDDEVLEENLAVRNMVTRVEIEAKQDLGLLERRMGELLGDPWLEQHRNPVGPEVICEAFRQAVGDIESGIKVKLIILKLFDRYVVGEDVLPLYRALNAWLVQEGVLPELKLSQLRRSAPGTAAPAVGAVTGAMADDDVGEDLFAALQAAAPGLPGLPAGGIRGGMVSPAPVQQAFMQGLDRIQHGDPAAIQAALGGMEPGVVGTGTVNVIHGIGATARSQGVAGMDALIIDVLAMLFDYILEDDQIPPELRAIIGRLQIPLLKVAMLDREFFARKSHPARRLLNRLAEEAVGCDPESDRELIETMEGIVQRILDEFEEDIGLFERLLEEFEAYLQDEAAQVAHRVEQSARLLAGKERLQLARERIDHEIRARLASHPVPEFIAEFLLNSWKNLLMVVYVKEGEESLAWSRTLNTMDQLLWSISDEAREQRARLLKLLPNLVGSLREGIEAVVMPEEKARAFLDRLAELHATIVNGQSAVAEQGEEAQPVVEAPEAVEEDREMTVATLHRLLEEEALEDVDIEEITLGGDEPVEQVEDEYVEMARSLEVGQWVEFRDEEGETLRAKLTWISPVTGNYLFTNRQGLKAADKTLHGLAAEFRRGQARLIDEVPLFERAVSQLVEGLKRQAG